MEARGSDFSAKVIALARQNAADAGLRVSFAVRSIYDLRPEDDKAGLIVCCEVLEHLEQPLRALDVLSSLADPYMIASVPREPVWRMLNLARGRYWRHCGNTPGHVQHWSRRSFVGLLGAKFEVIAVRTPLPWTMALCRRD